MEIGAVTHMMILPGILVAMALAVDARAGTVSEAPLQGAEILGIAIPRKTPRNL